MSDTVMATRKAKSYSLDDEHIAWIKAASEREGHGNESRVIQRLIEFEAIQRDGFDWRERVRREKPEVAA